MTRRLPYGACMVRSPGVGRSRWLILDVLTVVTLLLASAVEIFGQGGRAEGWGGPPALAAVLALVGITPVVARRRRPLIAAGVSGAAASVAVAVVAPEQPPFEPGVALLLVCYSVGVLAGGYKGGLLIAGIAAGVVAGCLANGLEGLDNAPSAVWLTGAWIVGRLIRSRTMRVAELESVTAQLALEREERARAAVLVERARIARELHDIVAHNVSVMVLHAQAGQRARPTPQRDAREALETIEDVGRQTVDELRRLLGILRSDEAADLGPPPSLAHIDGLIAGVHAAGLDVHVTVEGRPPTLPTGLDMAAYRIVQEALTNVLKHAAAPQAELHLRYLTDSLQLRISNTGTTDPPARAGNGLIGMRERVALYGGHLEAGAHPDGRFLVNAILPVKSAVP
jgi:signal transduction histidine kinase